MKERRSYEDLSDEALFALFKEKDEVAFSVLYKRYARRVYSYCARVEQTREAAEDLFQAIMLTVFEKRTLFIGGSFEAWLFTIVHNYGLRTGRARQRAERSVDIETLSLSSVGSDESDVIMAGALASAIAQLPEDYREAFQLKYIDGYPYDEIASILQITPSLARMRVFRARKVLQEALTPFVKEL